MTALVLVVVLLLGAGVPSVPPVAPDHLITLGVGIGPVRLGMNLQDVVRLLGPYYSHDSIDSATTIYHWETHTQSLGVVIWRSMVTGVITRDSRYRTATGLGVGSSVLDIEAVLGKPQWTSFTRGPRDAVDYYPGVIISYSGFEADVFAVRCTGPHPYCPKDKR
jgi:hypothetical protein